MEKDNGIQPIEENRVYFLFRRGKKEYIESLYENGEVYINSIDFIRNCDNNLNRSDAEDGIKYRKYIGNGIVSACDVGKDIKKEGVKYNAQNIVFNADHVQKGNIYCLTGIYSDDLMNDRHNIHYETHSFGDSLILIHRPKAFLARILKKLKEQGFSNYLCNKVHYYGNDYTGKVGFLGNMKNL